MLQEWKNILSNWINCYFNDTKTEECITVDTLLTIISHLHKNLNSDESKSSTLEAQNIEEFILEKYSGFKFKNGTVEPRNEEELYVVASLLLFFVCVNSKDVDLKQAMCSQLNPEDQVTIMKFSKSLMECSAVTYEDVEAAIIEACGQETASDKTPRPGPSVAETPPVLRSLHGEVRRLQAALDAERFDRNYLQEELSRTNLKLEKLLKDKEQYKLEIVNLKAKISLCCGEEAETRGLEGGDEKQARLSRQLTELEERLVDTQGRLEDAQSEVDTCTAKIEDLKAERDKWVTFSQEESSRAMQLAAELESEKRRADTLQEVVDELRAHHQNNRLDVTLECDDPDNTLHSLQNASVCSEACANVIEVQLGEERARVAALKQQIQCMQERLSELTQQTESQKLALENIINEKDDDICNLKHHINEEIEDKNNMKTHFDDEITILSNSITELENKIKGNSENARCIIEHKIREVETLQEEKLSLQQKLADETTKLENIIKDLQTDIDTEKNLKVRMKENYENQLMKLNEKVLNRNNELVELQNKIFEKGEMIEQLNRDLKNEKELNHELANRHNNEIIKFNEEKRAIESRLHQKTEEAKELQKRLTQNVALFDELNRQIDDLKAANDDLLQSCNELEESRNYLQAEIQQRDSDVEGIRREIESITIIFSKEKDKFTHSLEENANTINALQSRLRNEIQYKVILEKELQQIHQAKSQLNEKMHEITKDLSDAKATIAEKDRMVYALELYLKEERHANVTLKTSIDNINIEFAKLTEELSVKNNQISELEAKLKNECARFEEELSMKERELEATTNNLLAEIKDKEELELMLISVNEEKEIINKDLVDRCSELDKMQEDYDKLCRDYQQNLKVIEALESNIDNETKKCLQLEMDFDTQTSNLMKAKSKLNESERIIDEINSKSRHMMEEKNLQIQTLQNHVEHLNQAIGKDKERLETLTREKEALTVKLEEEITSKTNIEKEFQSQCAMLQNMTSQLNGEISLKSAEINSLKYDLESLLNKANAKSEELRVMETKLMEENEASRELAYLKNQEIKGLKSKIEELHVLNDEYEQELKNGIASQTQAIDALQRENEQLHFTIEEDNSNHEVILKEKDIMIEALDENVKVLTISLESLRKDYEDCTLKYENMKLELQDRLEAKENEVNVLTQRHEQVKLCLEKTLRDAQELREKLKRYEEIVKQNEIKIKKQIEEYAELSQYRAKVESDICIIKQELDNEKAAKDILDKEKNDLLQQNERLGRELHRKITTLNTEKQILAHKLSEEQTNKSTTEQELQAVLEAKQKMEEQLFEKQVLEKNLIDVKDRLQTENDSLIKQVEVLVKIRETHIAEKVDMEQQLIEKESTEKALLEEKECLTLQLATIMQEKENILAEKQEIERQLIEKETSAKVLLAEKENLLVEKQSLSILLESGDQVKESLLAEKRNAEQKLIAKEATIEELLQEKSQILLEKENILDQLQSAENLNRNLLAVKQALEQQLSENEAMQRKLIDENGQLIEENNKFSRKLESILEEKGTLEIKISEKEAKAEDLQKEVDRLTQQLARIESVCDIAEREKKALGIEKQIIEEQLKRELAEKILIVEEKTNVLQQLEAMLLEKEGLVTSNKALENRLKEEANLKNEFVEAKEYLIKQLELTEKEKLNILEEKKAAHLKSKAEIEALTQKYYKEQSERQILEREISTEIDEKNTISEVKEYLALQLMEEKANIKLLEEQIETLEQEKDSLSNKLTELMQLKSELEEERHYLLHEKNELIETRNEEISRLNELVEARTQEISTLNEVLETEKSNNNLVVGENNKLLSEICSLKNYIIELNAIQEILANDTESLNIKKEDLIQNLNVEKASRDELESEKNAVSITLKELNEKYAFDMSEKQDQLTTVSSELKQMRMDFKKHEDISVNISSVVNSGLEKLLKSIDKRENNELLQKLINIEHDKVSVSEKCALIINIAETLSTELSLRCNLEKALENETSAVKELEEMVREQKNKILELLTEIQRLEKTVQDKQTELITATESYNTTLDAKVRDIQKLQLENKSLNNELNDVKVQLNVKVHSLKEKLVDNENLTDKLKRTYESQIENLNLMVTKLTAYLKEKTCELDMVRKEKDKLQQTVDEKNEAIKSLEEEIKTQKANQEKLISDFESERLVIKNMVTVTESIMEDQKIGLSTIIADHQKTIETYQHEKKILESLLENTEKKGEDMMQEKQCAFDAVFKELTELRRERNDLIKEFNSNKESLDKQIVHLKEEIKNLTASKELLETQNKVILKEKNQFAKTMEIEKAMLQKEIGALKGEIHQKITQIETLQTQNMDLTIAINKLKDDLLCNQEKDNEHKIRKESFESELIHQIDKITKVLSEDAAKNDKFKYTLQEKLQAKTIQQKFKILTDEVLDLVMEKNGYISKLDEAKAEAEANGIRDKKEIQRWRNENVRLENEIDEHKMAISDLESKLKRENHKAEKLKEDIDIERLTYENRCALLQEYQDKAEIHIKAHEKEISMLRDRLKTFAELEQTIESLKEELVKKDTMIAQVAQGKDEVIKTLSKELMDEKASREKYQQELETRSEQLQELRKKLNDARRELDVLKEEKLHAIEQRETFAVTSQEKTSSNKLTEKDLRDRHQVSSPTSDLTHSSMESFKTINDLEKIIQDKNRTITTLQSDVTYMKTLMAESENKLLDVTRELEISKENCEQLSSQLKKLVHQKNEEIAELKKQVSKMSVTENRATQIIKVSAKYQAIILKRIAEIKSNTILKELTNFGNTANYDSDLKRNLSSGAITMEDLENFLETTDRHLKRCSEKQMALQKERDRLAEVNKINDSEIINMKKFLTELSVSIKTFNSIKDLYTQKLSRVVSMQRTVRREILSLDGQITDSLMCKLERGYAAVMQDLCECSMNLERWVERSIARTISAEKIKQAFTSDTDRASLAPTTFQNAGIEVQLEELENSFQKLLEQIVRSQKGEGARDVQAVTVMEVRAEYEDKLNRMKAKMKQLYQEQIQVFKNKQKEEIAVLERELQKTKEKLAESSRGYEEHIKALTTELWNVGEKFLMKKDEADWLRRKQSTGSLMSLQHLHSAGLATNHEEVASRPSDAQSLRSLRMPSGRNERDKREGQGSRGLHMSDEEGEVFDNRWLKELQTPRRESNAGQRLSELKWRNSLCPPHLKSSYPAETQFANTLDEEDIKCVGAASLGGRHQRKEVGITAYKKPGPPTPSKQAGRLSATDSELRESSRVEAEPAPRKTSTPSRIRALFRSARNDTADLPESPNCEAENPNSETFYNNPEPVNPNQTDNLSSDPDNSKRDTEQAISEIEQPKHESKQLERETEQPKCDTKHPNCDAECAKRDTEYPKREIEQLTRDTEHKKRETDRPKCKSEQSKTETEHPKLTIDKTNTENCKLDTEQLKREIENPNCESEQAKRNTDNPKHALAQLKHTKHLKREVEQPKLKTEHPKCESEKSEHNTEHPKLDTEFPKPGVPKRETEHSKYESEQSEHDSEHLKRKIKQLKRSFELPKYEIEESKRASKHPKREIKKSKHDNEPFKRKIELLRLEIKKSKCDNEHAKSDIEQPKSDIENPKREIESKRNTDHNKHDIEHSKCDIKLFKRELEQPKRESANNKLEIDHPKHETMQLKRDNEEPIHTEHSKCESEQSKLNSEYHKLAFEQLKRGFEQPKKPKRVTELGREMANRNLKTVNPNRGTEGPKCDTEPLKSDSEKTKPEMQKSDSQTPKSDWFKLSLRQRAALWEPLAKD